jgi:hypothetical protein
VTATTSVQPFGGRYLGPPKTFRWAHQLFFHHTHAVQRVRDMRTLVERLVSGLDAYYGVEVTVADRQACDDAGRYPPDIARRLGEKHRIERGLRLDFEALYMFGLVLLDQIGMFLSRLDSEPEDSFLDLVAKAEMGGAGPVAAAIWAKQRAQMRWLAFVFGVYRNTFIAHAKRPWQRGTVISRNTFTLFTPAPVGWVSKEDVATHNLSVANAATQIFADVSPTALAARGPGELLRRGSDQIGLLDRSGRDMIEEAIKRLGTETPTFQDVAERILRFVIEMTPLMLDGVRCARNCS